MIITDASGNVLMYSDSGTPSPPPNCNAVTLTNAQRTAFLAAQAAPNGGYQFVNGVLSTLPFVPVVAVVMTAVQKLATIGLTVADLKTMLGLP